RINVPCFICVDRNGDRTACQDRKYRRNHCKIGDNDLVALVEIENTKRQVNCRGAAADSYGAFHADFPRETLLELVQKWASRRYPWAVDGLAQFVLLRTPNVRTTYRYEGGHRGTITI